MVGRCRANTFPAPVEPLAPQFPPLFQSSCNLRLHDTTQLQAVAVSLVDVVLFVCVGCQHTPKPIPARCGLPCSNNEADRRRPANNQRNTLTRMAANFGLAAAGGAEKTPTGRTPPTEANPEVRHIFRLAEISVEKLLEGSKIVRSLTAPAARKPRARRPPHKNSKKSSTVPQKSTTVGSATETFRWRCVDYRQPTRE